MIIAQRQSSKTNKYLITFWVLLNIADAVTSLYGKEGNAFILWFSFSPQAFVLFKVETAILVIAILQWLHKENLYKLLDCLWCLIIIWNLIIIRGVK